MADEQQQEKQKPKELKDMTLGEIVSEMILTDRRYVELSKSVATATYLYPPTLTGKELGERIQYLRDHPPPDKESLTRMKRDLAEYQATYKNLQAELDRKEQQYLMCPKEKEKQKHGD